MAYEKQNFEDGKVLKAEHLNRMEDGIVELQPIVSETDIEAGSTAESRRPYHVIE